MRKANRVPQILRDLQRGYGAQKLPENLRAIDIVGIPTSNTAPAHRQLVKKILPRIKYNNQRLQINVEWLPKATKTDDLPLASMSSAKEDAGQTQSVLARLHFNGLPTTEFDLRRDLSSTELAKSLLQEISSATGFKIADPPAVTGLDEIEATSDSAGNTAAHAARSAIDEQIQRHDGNKEAILESVTASEPPQTGHSSHITKII